MFSYRKNSILFPSENAPKKSVSFKNGLILLWNLRLNEWMEINWMSLKELILYFHSVIIHKQRLRWRGNNCAYNFNDGLIIHLIIPNGGMW